MAPFEQFQLDHKDLPRVTGEGSVAILCMIDSFSGWPVCRAVKNMSAETTAKTFFESVVVNYGVPRSIVTDRGAAFCSKFFGTLAKLLGVKHRISSAKSPRTNGLAEQLVQRISTLLRTYASDDQSIETVLPLCELCIRCTSHTKLKISPFEVVFGRKI